MENLKKEIKLIPALATVIGTVIGSGVFFKAAIVFEITKTAGLGLLAWLLGGLITICAGLSAAELGAAIPKTGGMMAYIEYTYGKFWGYILGWTQSIIYYPAMVAALGIVFATQFTNLFNIDPSYRNLIGIISIISIALINLLGAKLASYFQTITVVLKLIPLTLIIVFGLLQTNPVAVELLPISNDSPSNTIIALGAALLATLFAYDGWVNIGSIAGELKNPQRDLPLSIFSGLCFITVIYIFVNFAFLKILPIESIVGNENAASDAAVKLFGNQGGKLITIGILVSVYGTTNGYMMTGMRVPYSMATKNLLPFSNKLSKLSSSTKVPVNSAILIIIIASLMIIAGGFNTLTDMGVFVVWVFFILMFIAVFILRKREPELERPYRVTFYPVIPIIAILCGLFIVVTTIINQPMIVLSALALTLVGVPVYFYQIKKDSTN